MATEADTAATVEDMAVDAVVAVEAAAGAVVLPGLKPGALPKAAKVTAVDMEVLTAVTTPLVLFVVDVVVLKGIRNVFDKLIDTVVVLITVIKRGKSHIKLPSCHSWELT